MKKALLIICAISALAVAACAYHGKQPKDDTYYKRTQGVEWPSD